MTSGTTLLLTNSDVAHDEGPRSIYASYFRVRSRDSVCRPHESNPLFLRPASCLPPIHEKNKITTPFQKVYPAYQKTHCLEKIGPLSLIQQLSGARTLVFLEATMTARLKRVVGVLLWAIIAYRLLSILTPGDV